MVQDELSLGSPAETVEGFKMGACKRDGIAISKDESSLKHAPLLHAVDGMRQLDVVDIDKLMSREQADAVMTSAELDGRSEQPLHAAVVGQLGDEISVILMGTIGAPGIVVYFLQRDKVGLVSLDELP